MTADAMTLIASPGAIVILTALIGFGFGPTPRALVYLAGLALSLFTLVGYEQGLVASMTLVGAPGLALDITPLRVDRLAFIFALIFHIAAALNVIYAWRIGDRVQDASGLVYAGAAIGGALAGDLLTLFVFWELAAISSVFLILAPGTRESLSAGMRYLVIQVLSGLLLLAGLIMIAADGRGLAFETMSLTGEDGALDHATLAIFLAFGLKAAFPFLHNWLQDSYPKATVAGTVILSAFTTKLAVYALARGFPGADPLIYIGATMTVFPVFFALIENNLRKVLAYSLNNQVGFMVCAVGVGSELAINGAAAHAFVHIIYKSLLFMSMGAVLYRVGSVKATDLGGLYRTMPATTVFCIIGAMSISAFPFFSGFVAKSLTMSAVGYEQMWFVWLALLFASAGVLEHSGIKIPYFAFFGHDSGKRPKEAPPQMLIAMGLAAAMCIGFGVFPGALYSLLPYPVDYQPYTAGHIVTQMQLLLFATLAFALLVRFRLYPAEVPSVNLDFDWFYRVPGRAVLRWAAGVTGLMWDFSWRQLIRRVDNLRARIYAVHGPEGRLARSWPIGSMALWTAIVLGAALTVAFFG